ERRQLAFPRGAWERGEGGKQGLLLSSLLAVVFVLQFLFGGKQLQEAGLGLVGAEAVGCVLQGDDQTSGLLKVLRVLLDDAVVVQAADFVEVGFVVAWLD